MVATAALFGLLVAMPGQAQIVANPMAPGGMRPTILVAPNGVPVVAIATPSAAGVSRNQFLQFDVSGRGVIVNNSRTTVQSQLGGFIQQNPYLATGPARVIVGEVYSSNPSYINGPVEIAGTKADFILANPAGIAVSGGTFINAAGVVLTTGVPQYNAFGGLDSYVVRGGTVSINGTGLDVSKSDYAAILARAVQVNAAIYATDLKVVTGANTISADRTQITPTTGTGVVPTFALDVSQLGGMFANHIFLVGTEAGLGVRSAGNIGASNGNLIVTSAGRLENAGTLEGTRVELASAGDIDNRNGTIRQTSSVGLTLAAPILSNTNGGVIGAEPVPAPTAGTGGGTNTGGAGTGGTTSPSTPTAGTGASPTSSGTAAPAPAPFVPTSPGTITAAGSILNDGGRIYSGGPIALQTPQINNAGGVLSVATMAVTGPNFSNAGGTLSASQSFSANVGSFDNTGGNLQAGSLNIATTGDLNNTAGKLVSSADATLTVGGQLINASGAISATGALTANVAGATNNSAGTLASNQALTLNTGSLDSTKGGIQSAQAGVQLAVTNQLVNGSGGAISAAADLGIQAGSLSNGGSLRGGNDVSVAVGGALGNDGSITAGRNTNVAAGSLQSSSTGVLAAGVDASGAVITPGSGNLSVTATQGLAAHGSNLAGGNASFTGASVDLSGSQTSAANITAIATQGNVTTSGATVVAGTTSGATSTPGTLAINANAVHGQSLVNQNGKLNAAQLQIQVGAIDNSHAGQITQTGLGALQLITPGAIDNSAGGRITAAGALDIQAGQGINNSNALIASVGALSLQAASLSNNGGTVASSQDSLSVNTTGAISNQSGYLQAANNLALQSTGLVNDLGAITAASSSTGTANSLTIDTRNAALSNVGGTIASAGRLGINSGALSNDGGLLQSGAALAIDTHGQTLTNTNAANYVTGKGGIVSQDSLSIQSGDLDNSAGFIGSKNALTATTGQLLNSNGLIIGQSTTSLTTTGFANNGGQVQSVGNLDLTGGAGTLDNSGGLLLSSGNTTLSAGAVLNNNTTGTDQGIEGNNVSLTATGAAGSISNVSGAISAGQNATLTSAGSIDNSAGFLSAGNTLTLTDPNAANPAAMTLMVKNTGGIAIAGTALNVSAASVTQDGQLLSQGDLSLTQQGDVSVTAGGQMIANGNLTLNTSGNVTNAGKIAAGKALTIGAANLDNQASGEISSQSTTLNISNTLTNRGLIDGNTTLIHAGTVDNIGTGRIYGDQLSIGANTLNNRSETVNGVTTAGTIAARTRLDLGVGTLNNLDGALIYSGGNAAIGGALDSAGHATGSATLINNTGATIQAAGNLSINTATLNNANAGVTWTMQPVSSSTRHIEYQAVGDLRTFDPSQVVYTTGPFFMATTTENVWPTIGVVPASASPLAPFPPDSQHGFMYVPAPPYTLDSPYAPYILKTPQNSVDIGYQTCTTSGNCTDFTLAGACYPPSDPIWSVFGVAPPDASSPGYLDHNIQVGQTQYRTTASQPVDFPGGPVTQAQYDQWHGQQQALDTAITAMVTSLKNLSTNKYTIRDYTETGQTPVLTSSAPGRILSGGTMDLNIGSGTNASSQIVAGGALNVTGGSLSNTSTQVDAQLTRTGTAYLSLPASALPFTDTTLKAVTLAAPIQQGNTAVGGGTSIGGASSGHTSQGAAGTSSANGSLRGTAIGNPNSGGSSVVNPIVQVALSGSTSGVIRTTSPNTTLPSASLFQLQPGAGSRYLIATDPAFAQYRTWLSSDYLLNNLGQDPNNTLKRLGDGFYEQQLIDQQVMQLTGQRYLDGYGSDQTEYTALMNSGVTFAQKYHLTVGVALTDAQMAQLTSDIVWLVQQTVTLPDGTTQQVLVPQVYVRAKAGDLDGSSGILAGNTVNVKLTGDLTNSASIAGRKLVSLTADNIDNSGRIASDNVSATAHVDLNNIGGVIVGKNSVSLSAGRDLTIASTTRSNVSNSSSALNPVGHTLATTELEKVAGVYVTGDGKGGTGTLSLDAGRDVNINGATVSNAAGGVNISAGRDVNLGTVDIERAESNVFGAVTGKSGPNFQTQDNKAQVGSTVSATGNVNIAAGNNLNAVGAHIASSAGSVNLGAVNDINITSGSQSVNGNSQQSIGTDLYKSQTSVQNNLSSTIAAAKDVNIEAGHDINIAGARIAAGADAKTQAQMLTDSQALNSTLSNLSSFDGPRQAGAAAPGTPTAPTSGTVSLKAGHDVNLLANSTEASGASNADFGHGNYTKKDSDGQGLQATQLSGNTVNIKAGNDLTSVASIVNADSVNLTAGNNLNLLAATLQSSQSMQRHDGDSMTIDTVDAGSKDQKTVYNQINAKNINLQAGGQVNTQIGGIASVQDVANQPGMGWMNQLMNDPSLAGKVNWQRIEETHEQWAEKTSTLGPVAQAVLVVVVGFATAGAGTAATGSAATVETATVAGTTGTGLAGTFGLSASTAAAITPAVQAAITSIATQASVSFANNNGDIGAVLRDLGSSQGIKNILGAIVTAGALQGLDSALGISNVSASTSSWQQVLGRNLIDATAASIVNAAVQGTSLEKALASGLLNGVVNAGAAEAASEIGLLGPASNGGSGALNTFTATVAHAVVGCLAGAAKGSAGGSGTNAGTGCSAGAIGATIGDLAAQAFNPNPGGNPDPNAAANTIALAQLTAGIAGAIVGGGQAGANIASAAGANAVENNWLAQKSPKGPMYTSQQQQYDAAAAACNGGAGPASACDAMQQLAAVSAKNESALHSACSFGAGQTNACVTQTQLAQANGNTVVTDGYGNTYTTSAYPNGYPTISASNTQTGTFHGQVSQSTADGIILEAGNQVLSVPGAFIRWQAGIAPAQTLSVGQVFVGAVPAGFVSDFIYLGSHGSDATPAGLATAFAAGYVGGGITRRVLNYGVGLPHTMIPLSVDTVATQAVGAVTGYGTFNWMNQTGVTASGNSWWTSPLRSTNGTNTNNER
jgi:filamentous hemagglutinin